MSDLRPTLRDANVRAGGELPKQVLIPACAAGDADELRREDDGGAVVDHHPALVDDRAVDDASRRERAQVAGNEPVDEIERTRTLDVDLVEHREVEGPH